MGTGPVRTCVACRSRRRQEDLIRIVRGPDGAARVDIERRVPGRGAYICFDPACVAEALASGRLRRGLRREGALPEGFGDDLLRVANERP